MTTTYTIDVFSSLDGFGSYGEPGDWGGYWGKEGPEFLAHRAGQYSDRLRFILGANTFRVFTQMVDPKDDTLDAVNQGMVTQPITVVSNTLEAPLAWENATLETGDAVEVVRRLKEESDLQLRSHGSMSMNRALLAAGLVDRLQVTIFPVITGISGDDPILKGADDFDLELLDSRLFDGRVQELTYRPTLHR